PMAAATARIWLTRSSRGGCQARRVVRDSEGTRAVRGKVKGVGVGKGLDGGCSCSVVKLVRLCQGAGAVDVARELEGQHLPEYGVVDSERGEVEVVGLREEVL